MATNTTRARQRESKAKQALRDEQAATTQRIEMIDREAQALQGRMQLLNNQRAEMLGRLRYVCEQLGEVEPLPVPPPAPAPIEEAPQEN